MKSHPTGLDSILGSDPSSMDYEVFEKGFRFCPFTVELNLLCDLLEECPEGKPPRLVKGFKDLWKTDGLRDATNEKLAL